jgi:glyoxylase-like metal-dependent hydrolase (beta-lactamase superfamily II)
VEIFSPPVIQTGRRCEFTGDTCIFGSYEKNLSSSKKGAGKNILVDAGFLKDIPQGKYFEIVNYIRPDSALAKVALKPEDITDIILTHPHWDHIDGVGLFPKAHIWVQKDDYGYFVGAAWQNGNNGDLLYSRPHDARLQGRHA